MLQVQCVYIAIATLTDKTQNCIHTHKSKTLKMKVDIGMVTQIITNKSPCITMHVYTSLLTTTHVQVQYM